MNELDSPHIIKLHDSWIENAGKENAQLVLIMEDGGKYVVPHESIGSMVQLRHIMKGTLLAMKDLNRQGIAHFDIKPGSIMVDGFGKVRLSDLGSAIHLDKYGEGLITAMSSRSICHQEPLLEISFPGRMTSGLLVLWD